MVRKIRREGHEIGSHGYDHDLAYDLGRESFREDVHRSKSLLEDIIGEAVVGYRAPNFSITEQSLWVPDVLAELGFVYDSSVYPLATHDRYGLTEYGQMPFVWPSGVKEIPLAVANYGKATLPVGGGGYFRLFPYRLTRSALQRINREQRSFTFYLHPWELDPDQPREKRVPRWHRFRHYVNLSTTSAKLRRLVADFEFDTIRSAYNIDEH
jgi:polysaccharide deacetylase family protein (PEP-CTERM system associated)